MAGGEHLTSQLEGAAPSAPPAAPSAPIDAPTWRITLFGATRALGPGGAAVDRFRTRKVGCLLGRLALRPGEAETRISLVELFWPDTPVEKALGTLRSTLASLRALLEPPGVEPGSVIEADRTTIRLRDEAVSVDAAGFDSALAHARRARTDAERLDALAAAVDLYGGDLMPGWDDEWIGVERDRRRHACFGALDQLLPVLVGRGDAARATDCAHRMVVLDRWDEAGHLWLLRALQAAGLPGEARAHALTMARIWRSELQTAPPREVESLLAGPPPEARRPVQDARRPAPNPQRPAPGARPPIPATRFFGRVQDISACMDLLRSDCPRIVTMLGPGGVGKTRLASEVCLRVRAEWGWPVYFVRLADVAGGDLVEAAVARALRPDDGATALGPEAIDAALDGRPVLLALDNAEHVADGVAALVARVSERHGELRCLLTSREYIGIMGEQALTVKPLPVPARGSAPTKLLDYPSAQLFADRARQRVPDFAVTPRNADDIREICAMLCGVPLAIELAASHTHYARPAKLRSQLEQGLGALRAGIKAFPPRHESLRAVVAWSRDLLDAPQRSLFARLSVFRGGWDVPDARAVAPDLPVDQLMGQLAERSLITLPIGDDDHRCGMLEVIRQCAADGMGDDEQSAAQEAHARHFLRKAASGPSPRDVDRDATNYGAALEWAAGRAPEEGLRAAIHLANAWMPIGRAAEGEACLERALMTASAAPADLAARGWMATGALAYSRGMLPGARAAYGKGLAQAEAHGLPDLVASGMHNLGLVAWAEGDLHAARAAYERALAVFRERGHTEMAAAIVRNLGGLLVELGDMEAAHELLREALIDARHSGDRLNEAVVLHNLGGHARRAGAPERAQEFLLVSLAAQVAAGGRGDAPTTLGLLAVLAAERGDAERGTILMAAAAALRAAMGTAPLPDDVAEEATVLAVAAERLTAQEIRDADACGRGMTFDQAVAFAFAIRQTF